MMNDKNADMNCDGGERGSLKTPTILLLYHFQLLMHDFFGFVVLLPNFRLELSVLRIARPHHADLREKNHIPFDPR